MRIAEGQPIRAMLPPNSDLAALMTLEVASRKTPPKPRNGIARPLSRDMPKLSANLHFFINVEMACQKTPSKLQNGIEKPLRLATQPPKSGWEYVIWEVLVYISRE